MNTTQPLTQERSAQTRPHKHRWLARLLAAWGLLVLGAASAQAQDLAVNAVLQPVSGCALSNHEAVSFRIFNYGPTLPVGSAFLVSYFFTGSNPVTETVTLANPLPTNASLVHTFTAPADLSLAGGYSFTVAINPNGDINPGNNTISGYVVQNSAQSVAGTLSGPASGSSGTLTLGASTGSIVQWEESPDNLRWFKLANSASTQAFSDLASTTRFRVRVANTPCAAVVSNVVTVASSP